MNASTSRLYFGVKDETTLWNHVALNYNLIIKDSMLDEATSINRYKTLHNNTWYWCVLNENDIKIHLYVIQLLKETHCTKQTN